MTPSPERERARVGVDVKALADQANVWYALTRPQQAHDLARLAAFASLVLEEAAKAIDIRERSSAKVQKISCGGSYHEGRRDEADECASTIRSLKPLPVPVAANEGAT